MIAERPCFFMKADMISLESYGKLELLGASRNILYLSYHVFFWIVVVCNLLRWLAYVRLKFSFLARERFLLFTYNSRL